MVCKLKFQAFLFENIKNNFSDETEQIKYQETLATNQGSSSVFKLANQLYNGILCSSKRILYKKQFDLSYQDSANCHSSLIRSTTFF